MMISANKEPPMWPISEVNNTESIPKRVPTVWPIKKVSEYTGLSYHFLRQLCLENKIVFVRAGNKYLINVDKLIDFLNGVEVHE